MATEKSPPFGVAEWNKVRKMLEFGGMVQYGNSCEMKSAK